jgi:penicillin-binding protein 1A
MSKQKKSDSFSRYNKMLWKLYFGGILFIGLIFLLASFGIFGKLPSFEQLENPKNDLATQIISEDGETIGKIFRQNRTPIKFKDLPKNLIDALIATEDARFYKHSGIDFRGTTRAVAYLGSKGGASTISQQLSKLLFTKGSKSLPERLIQKIKEWIIAVRLESQYTKEEIIAMYLNKYDFLNQAVGIRSASRIYFGKEPKELTQKESAMLVGMLKNSSLYNPLSRKELVKKRRNVVLKQMEKYDFITTKLKDSLQKLDLDLDIHREDTNDGIATYFREYVRKFMKNWLKTHKKPDGSDYNMYTDGLKIYTTIDSRMQKYAEEAMQEHMTNLQNEFDKWQDSRKKHAWAKKFVPYANVKGFTVADVKKQLKKAMRQSERWRKAKKQGISDKEIEKTFYKKQKMRVFAWKGEFDTIMTPYDSIKYYKQFLHTGLMSVEPQTGHIKAWVGGINHKHFKYDAVKQQVRQVGSTFKPFVYATAINQLKLSPCKKFPNIRYTIPKEKYGMPEDWSPKNAGDKYGDEVTLKEALAKSLNVISARLVDMAGPNNVVKLAKKMGVKTKLEANPSIALGAVDLSLYEMIGALSTFANKGMHIEPIAILRIEDKNGAELDNFNTKRNEVVNPEVAYAMINLMEGVTKFGSGARLRSTRKHPVKAVTGSPYGFTNPIAGKTGTTQNQSDGWFMGIVPNLATGVWVGAEDRAVHFPDISRGQGATMALPIWAIYYKKMYADKTLNVSKKEFVKPGNINIELDCDEEPKEGEEQQPEPEDDFDS